MNRFLSTVSGKVTSTFPLDIFIVAEFLDTRTFINTPSLKSLSNNIFRVFLFYTFTICLMSGDTVIRVSRP